MRCIAAAFCYLGGILFAVQGAQAANETYLGTNDFGGTGLLQTPSARFQGDGMLSFGYSMVEPYNRGYLTVQALPWLEASLRYTEVTNRLYGAASFSGDQSLKDRGMDLKLKLWDEGKYRPQLALGLRDSLGTGLFSSEYLVGSKRFWSLDTHIGIAWGNLGSRGNIDNPLSFVSDHFKNRSAATGQGGTFKLGDWFSGEQAAIFAGLEYTTDIGGLRLQMEYDGNDYQHEPGNNHQPTDSPFNFGVKYRATDWFDIAFGLERGNTFMANFTLYLDMHKEKGLPKFDPPPEPIRSPKPAGTANSKHFAGHLFSRLTEKGYKPWGYAYSEAENKAEILVAQNQFAAIPRATGRIGRILANELPEQVTQIKVSHLDDGLLSHSQTMLRKNLEAAASDAGSPEEVWVNTQLTGGDTVSPSDITFNPAAFPSFDWNFKPSLRQHIGGPDNFYFWQLWLAMSGELKLNRHWSLNGAVGVNLANNLGDLKLESDSALPHVRSDIKHYLQEGEHNLVRLQVDYMTESGKDLYSRVSAGIFEEMYGGFGGEILYRPFDKRWALGADINWVQQRDYNQRFSFRDYQTVTGHVNAYYQMPYHNILLKLSAGRYLAKDYGLTFDISREFDNGMRVGGFATFTDVSAEEFGEGSFDKGIYISMPLDMLSTRSKRGSLGLGWRPLTRDGGQKLKINKRLYDIFGRQNRGALLDNWSTLTD
jgi:hypothetical protein